MLTSGEIEPARKGLYFGGERPAPAAEHRWMVYAVDWATGKIVWEREAHRGAPPAARHLKNSYASETPVTDGERLYAYFGNVGLFCFDLSGKLLWSQRWDVRPMRYGWGTAASPVLHQGRLFVVNDNDEQSFLIALDARTGRTIWRVDRQERSNWATPFIWENERRTEIVTPGTGKIRSYDLDGKPLWELGPMSSITIPTPFARFGLLYVASGYVGDPVRPVYAIRPGASGDITLAKDQTTSEFIAWHLPQGGPYNPSPLVYGDYYYTLYDRGFITCHDARTGREIYAQGAHRSGDERLHRLAVGLQRKNLRAERRGRHLRDSGGARLQAARKEPPERVQHGDAGDCARQRASQDGLTPLPHCRPLTSDEGRGSRAAPRRSAPASSAKGAASAMPAPKVKRAATSAMRTGARNCTPRDRL